MSNTLYRKYRPKKFDELVGQNHIKITLENQISSDNISHAYLFTGPRGVGKTTTARLLAAAVNIEENENVDAILKGKDIDVIEIDAASNTSVDNVRENIIENSSFTPNIRKYKVFIIDEVHMLSLQAFNALLKILEEPPTNTIFILATTELHKIPATIVSRCQRFDFRKILSKDIVERLNLLSKQEGVSIDTDVLYDIARHSEGCLRDAESLLGQVLAIGEKNITKDLASIVIPSSNFEQTLELLELIVNKNVSQAIIYINENLTDGVNVNQFFKDLLEILRKILISKVTKTLNHYSFDLSDELEKKIIKLSNEFTQNQLLRLIDIFSKKRLEVKNSIIPQMSLELGVIEYIESQNITQSKTIQQQNVDGKKKLKIKEELAVNTSNEENPKEDNISEPIKEVANKNHSEEQSLNVKLSNEEEVVNATAKVSQKEESITEESLDTDLYDTTLTIDIVKSKWKDFLSELQKKNTSLVLILKNAEPSEMIDGVLKIGYKYVFHKDKIMNGELYDVLLSTFNSFIAKIKRIEGFVLSPGYVSEFIQEITVDDDVEFIADTSIQENTTSIAEESEVINKQETSEDLLNNLVQAFGGRVVE